MRLNKMQEDNKLIKNNKKGYQPIIKKKKKKEIKIKGNYYPKGENQLFN